MDRTRARRVALALAVFGGLIAFLSATELFPYRSMNHDEGVYLQQAAMLLEGQVYLRPPEPGAMRPWFFVESDAGMYSKYAPVPPAVFALGKLLGAAELALVGVGAALVGLTYDVSARAFDDRRVGLVAAAVLCASPLFVVQTGTFLPYAVTTVFNLGFAASFLRADDAARGSYMERRWAALAGLSIGLAFFARPYTAVLFAAPFILAALSDLYRSPRSTLPRHGYTALAGLLGVGATLAYNYFVTGAPLTFPYQAFAPLDGLGFGQRRLLGHELDYTPALALEANWLVVRDLLAEWVAGGIGGTVLAALGALVAAVRARRGVARRGPALIGGLFVSVVVGNVYFWGNYNILGALSVPDDGLIHLLGPYYHFDALLPVAAFGAVGVLSLAGWCRRRVDYWAPAQRRAVFVTLLLVGAAVGAGLAGGAALRPVSDNAAVTDEYAAAYEPIDSTAFEDDVVFLPPTYGRWLNHPFQHLRNDPGFDGPVVYALDYDEENFDVLEHYPERDVYRYAYRGVWNPSDRVPVDARLQRVEQVSGERVALDLRMGLPARADSVSLRVGNGDDARYYSTNDTDGTLNLTLDIAENEANVRGPIRESGASNGSLALESETAIDVSVFVDVAPGNRLSYDFTVPVAAENGSVRVLTPDVEACRLAQRCNGAAAYVPGADDLPPWVSVETDLRAN